MSVIIFEDSYILALALRLMVTEMKIDVIASYDSADDLVSVFNESKADCLLMDIQLKGTKTGVEAIEELRKYSEVPVIFLSGNNSWEVLNRIETISNAQLISKPYTEVTLKEKLIEMNLLGNS